MEAPKDLPIRLQDLGIGRLFESVRDAVLVAEADTGQIVLWNSTATQILGYSQSEALRKRWDVLVPERFKAQCRAGMARYRDTGHGLYIDAHTVLELPALHKSGEEINIEITLSAIEPVHDLVGDSKRLVLAIIRDITERKQTEEALKESEQRFRTAFEDAPIGVALVGLNGRYLRVNRALCEMVRYSEEELLEKTPLDLTHPDDLRATAERMRQVLEEGPGSYTIEKRYVRADGQVVWILSSVSLVQDPQGKPSHFISLTQDISDHKVLEEQLKHQAFHDSLTELPNRALFLGRLEHALARTEGQETKVAVLFIDLDRFKLVNDTLGHHVGDDLLGTVSDRLRTCLKPEDTLARLGGDEFTVLLEEVASTSDAMHTAERIIEQLRPPFTVNGHEVFVTCSIGVAFGHSGQDSSEELLRNAAVALHRAKEKGKACSQLFDPSMDIQMIERLKLENDLRRALKGEEFVVHYQPVVRVDTEQIVGMEALVRWKHPERGLVTADQFVPLAEEVGLIIPIGRRVLREACRQAKEWQERYPSDLPLMIGVNLSARELKHPALVEDVENSLRDAGLDPQWLTLEITESAVVKDEEHNIDAVRRLRALGVRFALDDFGTGYSALAYLSRLPVGLLKLDKSFVEGLGKDAEAEVLISGVISIASGLGLYVLAEGVETPEQLACVKSLGCDLAQGYHFSKPLSSEAATELLKAYNPSSSLGSS